jgi:transposase
MPLNVKLETTLEGYLFITFLSLILRMRLLKRMKKIPVCWSSIPWKGLLLELAKIKKIWLANGEGTMTEISNRQRTILETLGSMCITRREVRSKG